MKKQEGIEVWVDCDLCPAPEMVGRLFMDSGVARFSYTESWLQAEHSFRIDPQLELFDGDFFNISGGGNFGVFSDTSPDRWGRTLMKRREALEARENSRPAKGLTELDYLLGVQDLTRQGAIRLRYEHDSFFLDNHPLAAPPVARIRELESIAKGISDRKFDDLDTIKQWLSVLVAPSASLGGARPKANFTETDGSLWIAKFPAKDDEFDLGLWEMLAHSLGVKAGLNLPDAKVLNFTKGHATFCVKRFDRTENSRRFYASAMTLLQRTDSEGAGYPDIAHVLQTKGSPQSILRDLRELFARLAFNVAIGNKDDHLRNHGFLLEKEGWILAPAFDVNPNIERQDHVLLLDGQSGTVGLKEVLLSCDYYSLDHDEAVEIIERVVDVVSGWRSVASNLGIRKSEIALLEAAFSESQVPFRSHGPK